MAARYLRAYGHLGHLERNRGCLLECSAKCNVALHLSFTGRWQAWWNDRQLLIPCRSEADAKRAKIADDESHTWGNALLV